MDEHEVEEFEAKVDAVDAGLVDGPEVDQPRTAAQAQLQDLLNANNKILADNQLSMGSNQYEVAFNQARVQIRVLIEMLCEDEEAKVLFEIACQQVINKDLTSAVEELEAQRARQALTAGIPDGAGVMDLSKLREAAGGMNRQQRREMARDVAKNITRKGE